MANQYFENLLNVAFPNEVRLQNLDPADIQNFTADFQGKVTLIGNVTGKADFFNGKLTGLSKARRHGDCFGPFNHESKSYHCIVSFDDLHITYDGKMNYDKMPKVDFKAKANITSTQVLVEVEQNPNQMPNLKKMVFYNIGQLKIKFTGLGPLNRFADFLETEFNLHYQVKIFKSMNQILLFTFGRAVSRVSLP